MSNNFFVYQQQRLRILLGWGLGSTLVGLPLLISPSPFWRSFGLQAASWGLIDAILAILGGAGARRKATRVEVGELGEEEALAEARSFRRILLINVGLDLLYIGGGLTTARRAAQRPGRQGMGMGIALQGLFLLIFDSLLAREVAQRWIRH